MVGLGVADFDVGDGDFHTVSGRIVGWMYHCPGPWRCESGCLQRRTPGHGGIKERGFGLFFQWGKEEQGSRDRAQGRMCGGHPRIPVTGEKV